MLWNNLFLRIKSRSVAWAAIVGGSLALLIWAKLRLVTAVPRTAYAVPDEKAGQGNAQVDPAHK